jgi:hypothetical protein
MSFIRPEARETLLRWREAGVGLLACALGLWWALAKGGLFLLPGIALLIAGAALIWIGVQRARFRAEGQGPGSVQVDEGQITYYGPLTGGAVALREITAITYDSTLHPAHWRLRMGAVPELLIPVNAEGSDGLFDAFATLPGFRMTHALNALQGREPHPIVIWQRDMSIAAQRTLH